MKEWDINIYRGILTGFNEAFIIDGKTKDALIAEDPKSAEIIRPILRGKDIKKYKAEFADLYLIATHNGIKEKDIPRIDVEKDYPSVFKHLKQFENELKKRQDKGNHWTNLRNCAYWEEFEKEKIIFQEIVQEPCFILDEGDKYFCLDTARVITGENLKYLLCVFNSNLFFYAVKQFYGGGGLGATGVRMKHTFFENFCVPKPNTVENITWIDLSNQLLKNKKINAPTFSIENEINRLIYELYSLTDQEIKLIER